MQVQTPFVVASLAALAGLTSDVVPVPQEEIGLHGHLSVKVATVSLASTGASTAQIEAGARGRLEVSQ